MIPHGLDTLICTEMPMITAALATRQSKEPAARAKEQVVARLWCNSPSLLEGLFTEDGRRFRVLYPGRASGRAGPDFRDSVIETESGELLTGDVEVHVDAPDWYSHRHNVDPNYNGVILHVVLHPRGKKTSEQQSKTNVPITSLGSVADLLGRIKSPTTLGVPTLKRLGDERMQDLLDRAGDERFLAKSNSFALTMESADLEEALYCALLEALGYAINQKPFRELAHKVPLATLLTLREEPGSIRLLAIKAMLIGAAGLLPYVRPDEEALALKGLLKHLPRTGTMAADRWRLFRVRPANHPARRVAGAAHLVDRNFESGLVYGLEEEVRQGDARHLIQGLTVGSFVGEGRAREIAVNVVLPFIHGLAGKRRDRALGSRCLEIYRTFPKLADNEITREMTKLLSTEGQVVENTGARRHQGLIHLYKGMTGRVGRRGWGIEGVATAPRHRPEDSSRP